MQAFEKECSDIKAENHPVRNRKCMDSWGFLRIKTWSKEIPLSPISSVRAHFEATGVAPRCDSHVMHLVNGGVATGSLLWAPQNHARHKPRKRHCQHHEAFKSLNHLSWEIHMWNPSSGGLWCYIFVFRVIQSIPDIGMENPRSDQLRQ